MQRFLITTLMLGSWLPAVFASGVGTTGNPLLRLPLGAAPAAMGDAYSAMSNPAAMSYNPATLGSLTTPVLTMHYQKRFLDLRVTSLQGVYPLPLGTLGAGLDYFSEGYIHETIHGLPTGSDLHSYSTRLLVGYGLPLYSWLNAGANLTWLSSVVAEEESAHSFTTDIGFHFPRFWNNFNGALAFNNLGTKISHSDAATESNQPTGMRLGLLYDAFADQQSALIWLSTLDLIMLRGGGTRLGTGSELTLQQFYDSPLDVVLRGGLQLADLENAQFPLTLGFGLIFQDFSLDYAFETFSDLGSVSRVSLTFQPRRLPGDGDRDGVIDPDDFCPDTPPGALVDEHGCPRDSDADGIFDGIDLCPHTPLGAVVDSTGCPRDSDDDGVYDGLDRCPGTQMGAIVDADGCPLDSDGDGVFDGIDQCPHTPLGAIVDAGGCPQDSDGDGVFDGIDQCPDTPPDTPVDMFGCQLSQVEFEFLETGLLSLQDVKFASNQAIIMESSFPELDRIGNLLAKWNELDIEIGGHTDAQGADEHNLLLSEQRAGAVRQYLLEHFPALDAQQLTASGYGESLPVADNGTVTGRAENRRVEFRIINDGELRREKGANWLDR
ncbi:MAG: OmpA family protein [Candidatus Delongbacteria bacterium]|nr:OmpA family protein [bacterium]MBL7033235.1 OmpA family protein [Candidatus Delongbacteria bacterium]